MPIRHTLRPSEVARLIAACTSARERLVLLALVETGLRASELSRLERGDLEVGIGVLRVVGRAKAVSPSPLVLSLLSQEFRKCDRFRIGVRQIQRVVRAVARKADMETLVTPDVLRRTWIKRSAENDHAPRRASERLLEAAADEALDIILVADNERRIVDLNRAGAGLLGLPREEAIGRRIEEFFPQARGMPLAEAWDSFVREGEQSGVCNFISGGGSRPFEYRAKAHFRHGFHLAILREIGAGIH